MTYKFKLEQFEGPLDLLLQLIEQDELDITELSLSRVTDQYIGYLNESPDILTEELADFLVVAAKLLLIKSRKLLPQMAADDEEGIDLEYQLKMYKQYYDASKVLNKMISKNNFLFPREKMVVHTDNVFNPPPSLTIDKMRVMFEDTLRNLETWVSLPHEIITKTISIKERIVNIQDMIKKQANINFKELLKSCKNKVEVIVTFLALLELIKQRSILVVQDNIFDEIVVKRFTDDQLDILNE